jgi:hypothetical protein
MIPAQPRSRLQKIRVVTRQQRLLCPLFFKESTWFEALSESLQGYVLVHMHDNTSDKGRDTLSGLALGGNLPILRHKGRRRPAHIARGIGTR